MVKIWRYITLAVTVSLLLAVINLGGVSRFVQPASSVSIKLKPPTSTIPASLFNLNLINLEYGAAWPTIPFLSWRNTSADWSIIEKKKGEWDFKQLDSDISLAKQQGVQVMLNLKYTPTWASSRPTETGCCYPLPWTTKGNIAEAKNLDDWKNYVRTVATRYQGKVNYYELWNEPNVKRFYSGTIENLVLLNRVAYEVLKEVDTSITIISSAMSPDGDHLKYFEDYLAQGGGNYADVIAYHFYVAPKSPEAMLPMIKKVQALMAKYRVDNKPLWNTESGWKIINRDKNINDKDEEWAGKALSLVDASAYIARSYILSWAAGVERLYWYAWGHRSMGLTDYDAKTPKPVATAYTEVQKWLVGSKMNFCASDEQNTFVCELKREGGYLAWIIWNPTQSLLFNLPKTWNVQQISNLSGEKRSLSDMNQVEVSRTPLLLERVEK